MKTERTERGFAISNFIDYYGKKSSIQKSSIVEPECIWLGIENAEPKIMARDAHKLGIETKESVGWIDYPVPDQVSIRTRMHLTRRMVFNLLPQLIKFVIIGRL